jgi:hypothetical protein
LGSLPCAAPADTVAVNSASASNNFPQRNIPSSITMDEE